MSQADQLTELERQCADRKEEYTRTTQAFVDLRQGRSKKEDRMAAFRAWHTAAIDFFNAHDRVIPTGSLVNADRNSAWYTDRAETAVNILETICYHYQAARDRAEELSIPLDTLRPSLTAFANIQRIVVETHPDIAKKHRDEFVRLGLPTHGFDRAESEKPGANRLDLRFFCVGCVLLATAIGMAIWGFHAETLTKDRRSILVWIMSLSSGFACWTFAGSLSIKSRGALQGFIITGTGGFAVWLLSNFLLFRE